MIKNVIFDIGGVIVKFKKETYLKPLELDEETEIFLRDKILFTDEWFKLSIGTSSEQEFLNNVAKTYPDYLDLASSVFKIETLDKLLPVYTKTIKLVEQLKKKGYRLFVISDMEEHGIVYMEHAVPNINELFDDIIYSCRVGMVKKDGNVFDTAMERFNVVPEETLFIDDVQANLDQASKRGIHTFQFTNPDVHVKELESMLLK